MKKEIPEYFIGLDAGTGSVGWAVTNEQYGLVKCKGKDLWGMRCFETAETAADRRLHRTSRRRLERRRKRLMLLQELFAEEITKIDAGFFMRLKESALYKKDKTDKQKNALFNDKDFDDQAYYKLYPTIHHLIKALIEDSAETDVRLLYLACHSIIKRRGHFLFEGRDFNSENQFDISISELFEYLREDMEIEFEADIESVKNILKDKSRKISDKQRELSRLFAFEKSDKQKKAVTYLLSGGTAQFADLFNDESLKDAETKNISFSKVNFDEKADELASLLCERFTLLLKAKAVYDCSVLSEIIGDEQYLSFAKVNTYEKHKTDLALLKKIMKKFHKDKYKNVFMEVSKIGLYYRYIGKYITKDKEDVIVKDVISQEEFYTQLKSILNDTKISESDIEYKSILDEIEKGSFLDQSDIVKHKSDLRKLKNILKKYDKDKSKLVFSNIFVKGNYCSYAGVCKTKNKKLIIEEAASQDVFYDYLKKLLNDKDAAESDLEYKTVLNEIDLGTFLPKQTDKKNSNIPYQLRTAELEKLLETACKHFPFLTKKDNKGLTVKEKIVMLLTFKIPYYIGPINDTHKKRFPDRCWVVKKENTKKEKITPWNFYDHIDKEKTAEAFITVRTNKCTYLIGEDVLPRYSLLYSEYTVLNELNNLKININGSENCTVKLKRRIYDGLFKKKKKVSQATIRNFLITEGCCKKDDRVVLSGIDEVCTSSLTSYLDLKKIIGDKIDEYSVQKILEDVIRLLTVYDEGDGRKIAEAKIKKEYPKAFTDEQLKQIMRLRFSGWGRLSRKLLESVTAELPGFPEKINIITALRETNLNLMELLSKQYGFTPAIEKINTGFDDGNKNCFSYKNIVDDLFLSPSVKRMLWQTLRIVNEVVKVVGRAPKKVFIEMARGAEAEQGRTQSRQTILQKLYENCKEDAGNWITKDEFDKTSKHIQEEDNLKLRSDKLYLYYTQLGRCMYCGKRIEINEVFNTKLYDIDHIYPQSKIKDDSLTNRVLVCGPCNKAKEDKYPVPESARQKQTPFWQYLQSKGFISLEKLTRLTRTAELSEKELSSFIARQLVETRQATKVAGQVLKKLFPDTEIVYVKARNVSDFRDKFGLIKCREINDMHHAHDAYLNIVAGNVYHTQFTNNPWNFIKENKEGYNFKHLFEREVKRNNKVAWIPDVTISCVRSVLKKNTPIYTRHSYCKKGGLFDQTIMKKGKGQFPLKAEGALQRIEDYGGYNKVAAAYYVLVEYTEKGKNVRSLETVPLYLLSRSKKDKKVIADYLSKQLQCPYKIIIPRIKVNALLKVNGFPCHLTAKNGNTLSLRSAVQFCCKNEDALFFNRILKYNTVMTLYEKQKDFKAYDDYTLRMYVKDELRNEKKKTDISENDFETSLRNKTVEMYDGLLRRYETSIYRLRPNSAAFDSLKKGRDKFKALSVEGQLKMLEEVLKLFRTVNENCDFSLIEGVKNAGKMTMGKKVSNRNSCILIYQSVTGIFEKRIDLLKL